MYKLEQGIHRRQCSRTNNLALCKQSEVIFYLQQSDDKQAAYQYDSAP
jgi:hypothetical protein